MSKYALAARHGLPSLLGWARLLPVHPAFAGRLLGWRLRWFLRRRLDGALRTPEGLLIDTPDMLIAYWSMFVERELHDRRWVVPLRAAERPLVVDVGANAGVFSLLAFCLNPSAEIIAFEPLPAMLERLEGLRRQTGMNLTVHARAVSRTVGEALFESPQGYNGTSHLSTGTAPTGQTFRVETTTLDAALGERAVTLLKIDVEGFECEVIAGGPGVLARTRLLIAEAHGAEQLSRLTQALGPDWRHKKLGSSDHLFWRE